jgi:hypothetical protein
MRRVGGRGRGNGGALLVAAAWLAGCGGGGPPLLKTAEVLATLPAGIAALGAGGRVIVLRDAADGALHASIYEGTPGPTWAAAREVALEAAPVAAAPAVIAPPASAPAAPPGAPPRRTARLSADGTRALVVSARSAGVRAGAVAFDLYDTGSGKRLGGFSVGGNLIAWEAAPDLSMVVLVTGERVQHRAMPGGEVRWEVEAALERDVLLADGTRKKIPGEASIATSMGALVVVPPPTSGPSPLRVLKVGAGEEPEAPRYVGEPPCAISADGTYLAARVGDDIQIYDVTVGKLLYTLVRAALNEPTALTFFPGGRELLVERRTTAPAAYDWRSGEEVAVLDAGSRGLVISPEGDRILATTYDALRLYRVR